MISTVANGKGTGTAKEKRRKSEDPGKRDEGSSKKK